MGKPGHRHGWSPAREGTWGTETSKYPEEEKSNEMPTVAASEEGRAKPRSSGFSGLRTGRIEVRPSRITWKGKRERVKAP